MLEAPKKYTRVLSIAGSDSGGGAGIQADLKTFAALGCYGLSVITAITAQNTSSVRRVEGVSLQLIQDQMEAVLEDIGTDAVKIGMLHSTEVIKTVVASLRKFPIKNIVLDPVMVSKSGHLLLQAEALQAFKEELLPLANLITPNLPEASQLLGRSVSALEDMKPAAQDLLKMGSQAILMKGGHLTSAESCDLLFSKNEMAWFSTARIETNNNHGTGCTLSAAIAAHLAKGFGLHDAVKLSKDYLTEALLQGRDYKLGQGHGPVHHFFQTPSAKWPKGSDND